MAEQVIPELTIHERTTLIEVIDKHIACVDSNRRNVVAGAMNNIKKKEFYEATLKTLRRIRCKVASDV